MRPRKSEPRLMINQSLFQTQAFLFLSYLFWVHFLLTELTTFEPYLQSLRHRSKAYHPMSL